MARIRNDFYPTPEKVTSNLQSILLLENKNILECCSGDDAIADVFKVNNNVFTNDIDKSKNSQLNFDATEQKLYDHLNENLLFFPDWVITNPPFNKAHEILPLAWENCIEGCAFLLRLSYLEPTRNRRTFLTNNADHLRYLIPVNPRIKFRKDTKNTDSVTVAWFVYMKNFKWSNCGFESPFKFLAH
jgi:hypothetical protein